jgi:hypothetical protein
MEKASRAQGLLIGRLADVGIALRDQASLAALTEDVVKTSEIEGERLNVVSGPIGRQRVLFEAPPAERLAPVRRRQWSHRPGHR